MRPTSTWLAAACVVLTTALSAQAPDREAAERARHAENLAREFLNGQPLGGEEMRLAEHVLSQKLMRPVLNIGQSARYAIAEIYLERKEPAKAVAKLEEILRAARKPGAAKDAKAPDALAVTQFNVAQIYRYRMQDVDKAVAAYAAVTGHLQALAQREILRTCMQSGRPEQAIKLLEERLATTREVGARLALMAQLGRLYQHAGQGDKAIAKFEQVAREATPERLATIRKQIVAEVAAAFSEIKRLQEADRWEEAEGAMRRLRRRCGSLRFQEREDEARAMLHEIRRRERELDHWNRERERREREREGKKKERED